MKYILCILTTAAMIAGFTGCDKKDTEVEVAKEAAEKAKDWTPETAEATDHDHSNCDHEH